MKKVQIVKIIIACLFIALPTFSWSQDKGVWTVLEEEVLLNARNTTKIPNPNLPATKNGLALSLDLVQLQKNMSQVALEEESKTITIALPLPNGSLADFKIGYPLF